MISSSVRRDQPGDQRRACPTTSSCRTCSGAGRPSPDFFSVAVLTVGRLLSPIAFAVRTRSCCPVRAMCSSPAPDRKGPKFARTILPHRPRRRHWHDRAMQSTPEAADRLARRAVALAFATQGLVFISLTTRLPRFSDRWDLSEVQLSLVLLMMVLLAGAGSVVAERAGARGVDSAAPAARRAARHRGRGPGGRRRRRPAGLHARHRGVRRRARHRRRDHQHAGGRARAPLRPPDPAVVPRRLDPRRHHRRRRRARRPRTCPCRPAGRGRGGPAGGRRSRPFLRREPARP